MDSKSYWKNREEENLRSNLKEEEEYVKEINRIYDRKSTRLNSSHCGPDLVCRLLLEIGRAHV